MMSGSVSRLVAGEIVVLVLLFILAEADGFSDVIILVFIVGGRGKRGLTDTSVVLILLLLVLLYLLIIYNIVVSIASQFMSGSSWLGVRSKALMSTPV